MEYVVSLGKKKREAAMYDINFLLCIYDIDWQTGFQWCYICSSFYYICFGKQFASWHIAKSYRSNWWVQKLA